MGNKNDKHKTYTTGENVHTYTRDSDLEKYGNSDVKALAAVYKEFTKDGILDSKETVALKSMDKALKGVEITYGFDSEVALITQDNGKTSFLLLGTDYKQKQQSKGHEK